MKKFSAQKVESTGSDKIYLPKPNIGVLKKDDTYFVFESGDEELMKSMLVDSDEHVAFCNRVLQMQKTHEDRITSIKTALFEDKDISKEDLRYLLRSILEKVPL